MLGNVKDFGESVINFSPWVIRSTFTINPTNSYLQTILQTFKQNDEIKKQTLEPSVSSNG